MTRQLQLRLFTALTSCTALFACASEHRGADATASCRLQKLRRVSFEQGVLATTVHEQGLVVLDAQFQLRYDVLAPTPGRVVSLSSLNPERAWDVALASTGDDVALVSVSSDGLDLRLAQEPEKVAHLSLQESLTFVKASAGADRLLAVAFGRAPAVAWAALHGNWLGEGSFHPDELPQTKIPSLGQPGVSLGTPANGVPAGYDAAGRAVFLSTDENGRLLRWRVSPEDSELDEGMLPSVGPRYFANLLATYNDGRFGAMWTQQESDIGEVTLGAAVLDEELKPVGDVISGRALGRTGIGYMSAVYCLGRFLFSWRDASVEPSFPSGLRQLSPAGIEIEAPIEIDYHTAQFGWKLHCLDQRVALAAPTALLTLECK